MRSALLASLLLFSLRSFGQPFISQEIASAPLPQRNQGLKAAAPAVAMALDERGVVIAWTAKNANGFNRLFVARLDGDAQIVDAVHEIPVSGLTAGMDLEVEDPSIAKSATGSGFLLAWMEVTPHGPLPAHPAYCLLDSTLTPRQIETLGWIDQSGAGWPPVARSGHSNWISSNGFLWRIDDAGFAQLVTSSGASSDMVEWQEFPTLVAVQIQRTSSCPCLSGGFPFPCGCLMTVTNYLLQVSWIGSTTSTISSAVTANTQAAIQRGDHDVLVAWFDGAPLFGGAVVAERLFSNGSSGPRLTLGAFGAEADATRPDIASDGERYVVVWRTKAPAGDYDVVGASVDRDSGIVFFPVARSGADERDPSVISVGNGHFLVAYEKISAGERRLAGRFIDFGSRRRPSH